MFRFSNKRNNFRYSLLQFIYFIRQHKGSSSEINLYSLLASCSGLIFFPTSCESSVVNSFFCKNWLKVGIRSFDIFVTHTSWSLVPVAHKLEVQPMSYTLTIRNKIWKNRLFEFIRISIHFFVSSINRKFSISNKFILKQIFIFQQNNPLIRRYLFF